MFRLFEVATFVLALATLCAGASNSCRQCFGEAVISFKTFISEDDASTFVQKQINQCATGGEFGFEPTRQIGCKYFGDTKKCISYIYKISAWRYCGNGGSVYVDWSGRYAYSVQALSAQMDLHCKQSVRCHGDCKCSECGC